MDKKPTVLFVDDESQILTALKRGLLDEPYKKLFANSGKEALEVSEKHEGEIDLLLTDVIMPEMNGMELSKAHRRSRPETKVLFMSGYSEDIIAKHGILKPGINFISKPLAPSVLTEKIRSVLDG